MAGRPHHFARWLVWGALALLLSLLPLLAQAQGPTLNESVQAMEADLGAAFADHFQAKVGSADKDPVAMAAALRQIEAKTGRHPAILWAVPRDTHLHLVLVTAQGEPIVRDLFDVPRDRLEDTVRHFYRSLVRSGSVHRLQAAQQLYDWLIRPYAADYLEPEGIELLLFCFGEGLHGLPVAALYDGEHYLVETYSSALIPAFNLIDTTYQPLQRGQILAMGASEFRTLPSLPAVPVELDSITTELQASLPPEMPWQGVAFLNEAFTRENFQAQLRQRDYAIVHLATHAEFQPGTPEQSFIELWDGQLTLAQLREIDWGPSPPQLLVLSACRTVVGDREAELGFAGLALQAGVKSAIASRWYVSDAGTLALMSEFYRQLPEATTKAEALRQAQLKLLRGEVQFTGDRLQLSRGSIALPTAFGDTTQELTHPFYWASFMVLSSPW